MTTPCVQSQEIANLKSNQWLFMEILKEVKEDVKDIKTYLYEKMPEHYASKSSVNRLWAIVWAVIWFVFLAVWWALFGIIFKQW